MEYIVYDTALPNDGSSERQYLNLIELVIKKGAMRQDRTGVGTRALHGATLRFNLSDGRVPLLTTKKVPWKQAIKELLWFLSGDTNIRALLQHGVRIWSDWPYARFVKESAEGDTVGKEEFERRIVEDACFAEQWGSIGPGYGKQWRQWEGKDGKVFDQIADVVEMIKNDPNSRRILFHGWNVADLDQMSLPPCHLLYQYFVADGRLSGTVYQRSVDCGLGLPWNLFEAAVLIKMLASQCNLEPGELFWVGHDVHVYSNHEKALLEQIRRSPSAFPRLDIIRKPATVFDYRPEDFVVFDYAPQKVIRMDVAV